MEVLPAVKLGRFPKPPPHWLRVYQYLELPLDARQPGCIGCPACSYLQWLFLVSLTSCASFWEWDRDSWLDRDSWGLVVVQSMLSICTASCLEGAHVPCTECVVFLNNG